MPIKVPVGGTLQGATESNRLDFYVLPRGVWQTGTATDADGDFATLLDMGAQYRIKVNDDCWASEPNPLPVYFGMGHVSVTAPCTK